VASQQPQPSPQRGGISISTLVIASLAAAAAAYVVSRIWGAGTLFGAAATPVIVALVSEALRRPAEKLPPISVVLPGGSTPTEDAAADPAAAPARAGTATTDRPAIVLPHEPPDRPAIVVPDDVPPAAFTAPRTVYSTSHRNRWRIALLTGLAAFAIVAVVYTITDLASGTSVTGSGSSSLFDCSTRRHRASTTSADPTTSTSTTQARTTTTRVTRTVTVPATTSAPTVTVTTPTTTATTPATTTPAVPATGQAAPDASTTAAPPADPAAPAATP
jgi:hypothetical protein